MKPAILIACPIYKREWILPTWLEYIEKLDYPLDRLGFMFELGPDDDATHDILWNWYMDHPEVLMFDGQINMDVHHEQHPDGCRVWHGLKYENMVTMRNSLIERATQKSDIFDYYFSLDSDLILEDPQTINKFLALVEEDPSRKILSPLSYMSPYETLFPSAMTWDTAIYPRGTFADRKFQYYKTGEVFKADIVMAALFMAKDVYTKIRYRWHHQGEDLGFAIALEEAGIESWAVWNIYLPHLMHQNMLDDYKQYGRDVRDINIYTS